jgi:NADH-quinone oxidoreductase subunit J
MLVFNIENIIIIFVSLGLVSSVYSLFNYHPMYSLLFFVLFLISWTFLLFFHNIEFFSFILSLIYVGAILVLFFYVILLLNLQQIIRDNRHIKKIFVTGLVFLIFNLQIFHFLKINGFLLITKIKLITEPLINLENINILLFNDYLIYVIIVGLILFIVLIGLVILLVNNSNLNINK